MFNALIVYVQGFLNAYGLFTVFLVGFFEDILFFIPSTPIFLAVGFLTIDPKLTVWWALWEAFWNISLLATMGVTLSGFLVYWLVYWGGHKFLERYGGYLGISWKDILNFQQKFTGGYWDELILFFCRALPFVPLTLISAFCGLIRLNWMEFFVITVIGTVIRVTALTMLGWWAGREYYRYALQIERFEQYLLLIIAIVVVVFVFYYVRRQRKKQLS